MSKQYIVSPSRVKTTGSLSVFLRVKLPTTKDKTWVYSLTIFNGDVRADKNGGRCQIPNQNSFSQDIMFKTELSIVFVHASCLKGRHETWEKKTWGMDFNISLQPLEISKRLYIYIYICKQRMPKHHGLLNYTYHQFVIKTVNLNGLLSCN